MEHLLSFDDGRAPAATCRHIMTAIRGNETFCTECGTVTSYTHTCGHTCEHAPAPGQRVCPCSSDECAPVERVLTPGTLAESLAQFIGTESYHQHWLGIVYTDGVEFLARESANVLYDGQRKSGGAYWLIDAVASWQPIVRRRASDGGAFQVWNLQVTRKGERRGAVLTCHVDTCARDPHTLGCASAVQKIEFTDFPLDECKLYVVDGVLMLPTEY